MADQANTADIPAEGLSEFDAQARLESLFKGGSGGGEQRQPAERTPARDTTSDTPGMGEEGAVGDPEQDADNDPQAQRKQATDQDDPDTPDTAEEAAADAAANGETEFEWEGKVYTIPKPIVEGAMRQADYTRKMQEVSERARSLVAREETAKIDAEMQQVLAPGITQAQNLHARLVQLQQEIPDPAVDPVRYLQLDKQMRDVKTALDSVVGSVTQQRTEFLQRKQSAQAELLQTGLQQLARDIPNWSDQVQADIARHAMAVGYAPEELNSVFDPRFIKMAHDAMQYRRLKDARPDVLNKKVANAAPTVRPAGSVNKAAGQRAQIANMTKQAVKSGRPQDAQEALTALFKQAGGRRR